MEWDSFGFISDHSLNSPSGIHARRYFHDISKVLKVCSVVCKDELKPQEGRCGIILCEGGQREGEQTKMHCPL